MVSSFLRASTLSCAGLLCAALVSTAAQAQVRAGGHVAALAGYDDNPALSPAPGERLLPGMGASGRELSGSGVLDLVGDVGGEVGGATWAGARLGFDLGWLTVGERRGEGLLRLDAGHRSDKAFGRISLFAGRFGATFGVDNATSTRARLSGGIGTDRLRGTATLLSGLRFYDQGAQRDGNVGGELALELGSDLVRLRAGARVDQRFSTSSFAQRTELSGFSELRASVSHLSLGASVAWQQRFFVDPSQNGFELTGSVFVKLRLIDALWLVGLFDWGVARGDSHALHYGRVAALAGLEFRLRTPDPVPEFEAAADASVHAEASRVIVHVHFPGAQRVIVIGSFNGWDEARGQLRLTGAGDFEGSFDASPGRHHYRLLVDGDPRLPPHVIGVPDDFGGVDGVVEVPQDGE